MLRLVLVEMMGDRAVIGSVPEHLSTMARQPHNSGLRVTPAMEAKVSDHVWTLEEIAQLAE